MYSDKTPAPRRAAAYTQHVFNNFRLPATAIATTGLVAGLVFTAPVANADDQGFLDELRANQWSGVTFGLTGQPIAPGVIVNQDAAIAGGHDVCNKLRQGLTPDQIVSAAIRSNQDNYRILVNAAQHHLC
jgi:hypothetical protein